MVDLSLSVLDFTGAAVPTTALCGFTCALYLLASLLIICNMVTHPLGIVQLFYTLHSFWEEELCVGVLEESSGFVLCAIS